MNPPPSKQLQMSPPKPIPNPTPTKKMKSATAMDVSVADDVDACEKKMRNGRRRRKIQQNSDL